MTRDEMREEVASEENNLMLAKRDLPILERTIARAKSFRLSISADHCLSMGDHIDNFLDVFDGAFDELSKAYLQLRDAE
jgi:hypothetical protein